MGVADQDDISDSELLEGLEDDEYREQRIRELQSDINRRQIEAEFVSRGGYREYSSEKEVMDVGLCVSVPHSDVLCSHSPEKNLRLSCTSSIRDSSVARLWIPI